MLDVDRGHDSVLKMREQARDARQALGPRPAHRQGGDGADDPAIVGAEATAGAALAEVSDGARVGSQELLHAERSAGQGVHGLRPRARRHWRKTGRARATRACKVAGFSPSMRPISSYDRPLW